jgi:hypothetical protein
MATILGKTWTIRANTATSPFKIDQLVEITSDTPPKVIHWDVGGSKKLGEWGGTDISAKDKVVVTPTPGVRWEFVGSEAQDKKQVIYGMIWTKTVPDAMGSWVSDPQGTP